MVCESTAEPDSFTASEGWLSKFLERDDLTIRRSTTVCQKAPDAYVSKLNNFRCLVRQRLEDNMIVACDETAMWYNAISKSTVEEKSCNEVSVHSTGHAKNRLTVLLSAKGDGTKLKPYIILPRKRPVPGLVKKFGSKAILVFQGTNWMNQTLTEDYISTALLGGQYLLHIDCLCGTASSVMLTRTQKTHLKS